ncbi:MAG: hypothetical protein RBT11_11580 [Desulfobacterales bacterium]|jgi:hypothetical protein|nr:hypothetical protein [Desulfobacterales bacterium]
MRKKMVAASAIGIYKGNMQALFPDLFFLVGWFFGLFFFAWQLTSTFQSG